MTERCEPEEARRQLAAIAEQSGEAILPIYDDGATPPGTMGPSTCSQRRSQLALTFTHPADSPPRSPDHANNRRRDLPRPAAANRRTERRPGARGQA